MKVEKGNPGYLKAQRNKLLLQTLISFGLVIAIFAFGYIQTGNRLNWFTFIAVLGCLPAAKVLVGLITIFPYKGIDPEKASEIEEKATLLTLAFDMVVTSTEKIMPIDAIAISGNTICGYAPNKKVNPDEAAMHIKKILNQNRHTKVTVKILHDYTAFLTRVEGLDNIAKIEQPNTKQIEAEIRQVILSISM